jgi:hypothetical protein
LPKPAGIQIAGLVSNYNVISQLARLPLFELRNWSGNQTKNRNPKIPGFEPSRALLEINNAVFTA